MNARKLLQKIMATILSLIIILSFIPAPAFAASTDAQDGQDAFTALGFSPDIPEGQDQRKEMAPYGKGFTKFLPINQLFTYGKTDSDRRPESTKHLVEIFGYGEEMLKPFTEYMNTKTAYSIENPHDMLVHGKAASASGYFGMEAIQDCMAVLHAHEGNSTDGDPDVWGFDSDIWVFDLYILDPLDSTLTPRLVKANIGSVMKNAKDLDISRIDLNTLQFILHIETGDLNGDGIDEIVVIVPNSWENSYPVVKTYSLDTGSGPDSWKNSGNWTESIIDTLAGDAQTMDASPLYRGEDGEYAQYFNFGLEKLDDSIIEDLDDGEETEYTFTRTHSLAVGDLNRDSLQDIAFSFTAARSLNGESHTYVKVLYFGGDGSFTGEDVINQYNINDGPLTYFNNQCQKAGIAIADINGTRVNNLIIGATVEWIDDRFDLNVESSGYFVFNYNYETQQLERTVSQWHYGSSFMDDFYMRVPAVTAALIEDRTGSWDIIVEQSCFNPDTSEISHLEVRGPYAASQGLIDLQPVDITGNQPGVIATFILDGTMIPEYDPESFMLVVTYINRWRQDPGYYTGDIVCLHEGINNPEYSVALWDIPDLDNKSMYTRYKGYELVYTDPKVLAALASPPYFEEIEHLPGGDNHVSGGSTSYGKSTGSGSGSSKATFGSLGGYVSGALHIPAGPGKIVLDTEVSYQHQWTHETATMRTEEQSVTFTTYGGQDTVVLYSIPVDVHMYELFYPVGDGTEYNVSPYYCNIPYDPVVSTIPLEDYNRVQVKNPFLPDLDATVFTHTLGEPESYGSAAKDLASVFEADRFVNAGIGNSSISQSLSITEETEKSTTHTNSFDMTAGIGYEFAGGSSLGVGVSWGAGDERASIETNSAGFTYETLVFGIPTAASSKGYNFDWKMIQYEYSYTNGDSINEFPVVTYLTKNVRRPPRLPAEYDVDHVTEDSVTLYWTPTPEDLFPGAPSDMVYAVSRAVRVGSQIFYVPVEEAAVYDFQEKVYRLTETGLAPNTEYTYIIQCGRQGFAQSIVSAEMTAVTLANINAGFTAQPDNITLTAGTAGTLNASFNRGSATRVTYLWEKRHNNTWVAVNNSSSVSGAETQSLTFNNPSNNDEGVYRLRVIAEFNAQFYLIYSRSATVEYQDLASAVEILSVEETGVRSIEMTAEVSSAGTAQSFTVFAASSEPVPGNLVRFNIAMPGGTKADVFAPIVNGVAKASYEFANNRGKYYVTAHYLGDASFGASSSDVASLVKETGTSTNTPLLTMSMSENYTYGDHATIAAAITTGSVVTDIAASGTYTLEKYDQSPTWIPVNIDNWLDDSGGISFRDVGKYRLTISDPDGSGAESVSAIFTVAPRISKLMISDIIKVLPTRLTLDEIELTLSNIATFDSLDDMGYKDNLAVYDGQGAEVFSASGLSALPAGSYRIALKSEPNFTQAQMALRSRYAISIEQGQYLLYDEDFSADKIVISKQPQTEVAVKEGNISASLQINAGALNGAAVSYQWFRNTVNSNNGGTAIIGATGASFAIPVNLTAGTYYYYCVVSADGLDDAVSGTAVVVVSNSTVPGGGTGSGGGGGGGGDTGSSAQTIPSQNGAVDVTVTISSGTAMLELPDTVVNKIIEESGNSKIALFDLSSLSDVNSAMLPKSAATALVGAGFDLVIKLADGTLRLSEEVMASIAGRATGENIALELKQIEPKELSQTQRSALKQGDIVLDINITSGMFKITSFSGTLTVEIPYGGPLPVSVWHLNELGEIEAVPCTYANGAIVFSLNHLSLYIIRQEGDDMPWHNPFTDVRLSDWFYGDVEYAVKNGLFNGTSATTFSPQTPMTRGMVVTVLGRLAGVNTNEYKGSSFDDVDASQYYAPYIEWAEERGIVSGVGGNAFAPDREISRQDLTVILYRYAQIMDITLPKENEIISFSDEADIASYAKDAVAEIQQAGIVVGKTEGLFDAQGSATRAEVAAMLHRFMKVAGD